MFLCYNLRIKKLCSKCIPIIFHIHYGEKTAEVFDYQCLFDGLTFFSRNFDRYFQFKKSSNEIVLNFNL